jgi:hypothetical protein
VQIFLAEVNTSSSIVNPTTTADRSRLIWLVGRRSSSMEEPIVRRASRVLTPSWSVRAHQVVGGEMHIERVAHDVKGIRVAQFTFIPQATVPDVHVSACTESPQNPPCQFAGAEVMSPLHPVPPGLGLVTQT